MIWLAAIPALAAEIRPGVWGAKEAAGLPLPVAAYQAYLVGELHGVERNAPFQLHYLDRLHTAAGVRDVAIEEDSLYERAAQRFVNGETNEMPRELCLRADVLRGVRELNGRLTPKDRIRIHLIDVDSPAEAIHRHLRILREEWKTDDIRLPAVEQIKRRGLGTVEKLKPRAPTAAGLAELRTLELSIQALQAGLEVNIGVPKGSTYLESREEAIAANLSGLVERYSTVLAFYGSDHISRTMRKDGGPKRNQPFKPLALRLQERAIRAYSLLTIPLQAEMQWRGQRMEMPWTAADGSLSTGETFDKVLTTDPGSDLFFIDRKREPARMVTTDLARYEVDGYVLFRASGPMRDSCR